MGGSSMSRSLSLSRDGPAWEVAVSIAVPAMLARADGLRCALNGLFGTRGLREEQALD